MEPTVFLANFSLFLGQLMFAFTTSIWKVFPMAGYWGTILCIVLQPSLVFSHTLSCWKHQFHLLHVNFIYFFSRTQL